MASNHRPKDKGRHRLSVVFGAAGYPRPHARRRRSRRSKNLAPIEEWRAETIRRSVGQWQEGLVALQARSRVARGHQRPSPPGRWLSDVFRSPGQPRAIARGRGSQAGRHLARHPKWSTAPRGSHSRERTHGLVAVPQVPRPRVEDHGRSEVHHRLSVLLQPSRVSHQLARNRKQSSRQRMAPDQERKITSLGRCPRLQQAGLVAVRARPRVVRKYQLPDSNGCRMPRLPLRRPTPASS